MAETYLSHHGIKGQKWGVRRFQNPDGTLTAEGRKRQGLSDKQKSTLKKVATAAGVTALAGLAIYGAVKYSSAVKDSNFVELEQSGSDAVKKSLADEFKEIDHERLIMDRVSNLEKYGKAAEDMYGVTLDQVRNAGSSKAINKLFEDAKDEGRHEADKIISNAHKLSGFTPGQANKMQELAFKDSESAKVAYEAARRIIEKSKNKPSSVPTKAPETVGELFKYFDMTTKDLYKNNQRMLEALEELQKKTDAIKRQFY